MTTCPVIPTPANGSTSILTAFIASLALTMLFFWGLAQSSDRLPPARSAPVGLQLG